MFSINQKKFGLIVVSFSLAFCSPKLEQRLKTTAVNQPQKPNLPKAEDSVEMELVPTYVPYIGHKKVTSAEKVYEKIPEKIENKQAEINLDLTTMSKVVMKYDSANRFLSVQGHAEIFDEDKKPIADTDFNISGQHSLVDVTFNLKPDDSVKINSSEKPAVRAKVTCLTFAENDQTNCSRVIIDFFIAYKKKIYTEQMEVNRNLPHSAAPDITTAETKKEEMKPPAVDAPAESESATLQAKKAAQEALQQEGEEDSLLGRYQGQTESADLTKIFEKDDDIQTVLKVTPEADVKTPMPKDTEQTTTGQVRPTNQAIGRPDSGTLRNATSLVIKQLTLAKNAFFEIVHPNRQRYFATYEMSEMITRLGSRLNQQMEKKLTVSDISQLKGGNISPHLSHQIGLDVDLGYPTADQVKFPVVVQMSTRSYDRSAYSVEKTYDLFKFAFMQPDIKVARIFADQLIKAALCRYAKAQGELDGKNKEIVKQMFYNIEHVSGHGDHFHLRLKCSVADPACRDRVYKTNVGCK